jgi:hypothetical protein
MKPEELDFEGIMAGRRKAVTATIQQINIDELYAMLPKLLPDASHPWHELFEQFLNENRGSVFHLAEAGEGARVIYCRAKEKGIWYIPNTGVGLLQAGALVAMKEIVDGIKT